MNPPAFPSRLVASLARVGASAVEITGPADVRERLRLAGVGDLADDQVTELSAELDLLAEMLMPGRRT